MQFSSEDIEELLWDLDEFYEEGHPAIEAAWEEFDDTGEVSPKLLRKLKRMRRKAYEAAA